MNRVNINNVIRSDVSSIKAELLDNSAVFLKKLVESLRVITDKPFSAYKVDLSLSYLKQVYERAFPGVKHGGPRISKVKETKTLVRNSSPDQDALSATWATRISLVDKAIVINLFKGIKFCRKVPSFVELIGLRSELSRRAIHNRIRVGNYIAHCTEANRSLLLFRQNKISHTKFLAEIKRKEKNEKNDNKPQQNKSN